VRLTLAQLAATPDPAVDRALLAACVREAAAQGADLVVLPEYASGFDPRGPRADLAEPVDGPYVTALRDLAREHRLAVAAGVTVRDTAPSPGQDGPQDATESLVSNAVVVVDAGGEVRVDYRKVHLYDAFGAQESRVLRAGDPAAPPPVVDVAGCRVGILTCYDLRFPESARRLADAGAEVVVVPAAWAAGPGKAEQWRVLGRARAVENVLVLAAVGMAGTGVTARSFVAGPDGAVLAELGTAPGLVTVDVDPAVVTAARERNPSLAARRYDVVPRPPTE